MPFREIARHTVNVQNLIRLFQGLLDNYPGPSQPESESRAVQFARISKQLHDLLVFHFENPAAQRDFDQHVKPGLDMFRKDLLGFSRRPTWKGQINYIVKVLQESPTSFFYELKATGENIVNNVIQIDTEHEGSIDLSPWKSVSLMSASGGDWDDGSIRLLRSALEDAAQVMSRAGFGAVCRVRVFAFPVQYLPLMAVGQPGAVASYSPYDDILNVSVKGTEHRLLVMNIVHELGHRYYFKFMEPRSRAAWVKFFEMNKGPLPNIDHILGNWQAIANRNPSSSYLRFYFPYLTQTNPEEAMWLQILAIALELDDKQPALEQLKRQKNKAKVFLHPVTAYSATNPEELFAETFSHYIVFGPRRVPELLRYQFRRAVPKAKMASNAHAKSIALMKFLSSVARRLGVAEHVYIVGGAVRNFIIKEPIKDIDVVVDSVSLGRGRDSAWLAREIAKAIPVPSSLATNNYGVAILTVKGDWILDGHNLNGEVIEIANARKESYGAGGYKPTEVVPATIHEDVRRREFTFNTLMWRLYDVANGPDKAEILDLTGCGLRDLQEGIMRCPSDPDKTFTDDPSRMIRAIKFLIKYRFKISPEVEASIRRNARKIKNIPPGHLSNMIIGLFYETGVGKAAFLEMDKLGLLDVIREIVAENRPFRDALGNWAEKHADIEFLFDLMDLHMPVGSALGFLTPAQKSQLREQLVGFSSKDRARDFVSYLQQPGKIVNMSRLIQVLGLKGLDIRRLTDMVRQLLLDDPALASVPDYLEDLIIKRMGGPRTASAGNVRQMIETFKREAIGDDYEIHELGKVEDLPILLLKPRVMDPDLPNLMVIAGTHGDEPSGPNVCLEILRDPPKGANLSFIPLVNPAGREKMTREDAAGKDPNRGWRKGVPTPEGKILKGKKDLLKELAKDGVLSFHEDDEADGFYIYDSENVDVPGPLARHLQSVGRRFFSVASPGVDGFGDERGKDGFIINPDDDAFEDWMHFDVGVTPVILVELPSKKPWDTRVNCGAAMIQAYAKYQANEGKQDKKAVDRVAARYMAGSAATPRLHFEHCPEIKRAGGTRGCLVAYIEGKRNPVGRIDWKKPESEGHIWIELVEVSPKFRRMGIASAMFQELFKKLHITKADLAGDMTPDGENLFRNLRSAQRVAARFVKRAAYSETVW